MRLSRHVEDAYVLDDVETDTWLRRKLSEAWSSCSWTCSGSRTHTNSGDDAVPQLNTKLRRGSGSSSARALRGSYPEQHVRRGSVRRDPAPASVCAWSESSRTVLEKRGVIAEDQNICGGFMALRRTLCSRSINEKSWPPRSYVAVIQKRAPSNREGIRGGHAGRACERGCEWEQDGDEQASGTCASLNECQDRSTVARTSGHVLPQPEEVARLAQFQVRVDGQRMVDVGKERQPLLCAQLMQIHRLGPASRPRATNHMSKCVQGAAHFYR